MRKISTNHILLLMAIILIVANGLFIWKTFLQKPSIKVNTTNQNSNNSSGQPLKILYGKGNAVIYQSSTPLTFSGSGLVETLSPIKNDYLGYIVGIFNGWQTIENSVDKYILIKEYNSGKQFKVRTSWSSISVAETQLIKEDISKINSKNTASKYLTSLGTVSRYDMLKPGSVTAILLETTKNGKMNVGPQKDNAGEFIANAVIIR